MWGKDYRVILKMDGWMDCISKWQEVTNALCSPLSSPAFLSSVIPNSWQRIWAKSGPWEIQPCHTHKHVLSVFCQSASVSLTPSLTHMHIRTLSHTQTHHSVQPKHPWGRASGCWKCQTALSRPISVREPNRCVQRAGMCACSAKTPNLKATSSVGLGYLGFKEWSEWSEWIHICGIYGVIYGVPDGVAFLAFLFE